MDKLLMPYGSDRLADVATYNALPTLAASICQAPGQFHKIKTSPGQGSVKNSCSYEVYVDSIGCGKGGDRQMIPAGGTWNEPLRSCKSGGVVYKVTKSKDGLIRNQCLSRRFHLLRHQFPRLHATELD